MATTIQVQESKKIRSLVNRLAVASSEWDFSYVDNGAYNYTYKSKVTIGSKKYDVVVQYEDFPGWWGGENPDGYQRHKLSIVSKGGLERIQDDGELATSLYGKIEKLYRMQKKTESNRSKQEDERQKIRDAELADGREMTFHAKYVIGFRVFDKKLVGKGPGHYIKKYGIAPSGGKKSVQKPGDYLEFRGDWYDLGPLYSISSQLDVVAALPVSEGVSDWFAKITMNNSKKVKALDTPTKIPKSLETYTSGKESDDIRVMWPRSFVPANRWIDRKITFQQYVEKRVEAEKANKDFVIIGGKGSDIFYILHHFGHLHDVSNMNIVKRTKWIENYDRKFRRLTPDFSISKIDEEYLFGDSFRSVPSLF